MVSLGRDAKTALIAIALLALVAVPTVYLTAIYREPMYLRYYVDPASAIHIKANGDITAPTFDPSALNIQRNGNSYTLTGNITNWLIIEKSNMVLEGNGFWVGGQNGLSLQGVSNVTVEDVNVKASLSYLYLQSVQNSTILRTNSQYNIRLFLSNGNLISDSSGSIDLDNSSNNAVQNCSLGSIELSGSNYNSILYSNCSYSGRSLSIDSSSHNLVFGNRFWGMAWWISMYRDSTGNIFAGNNISMGPRYYADTLTGNNFIYHNNFLNFAWNHTLSMPSNVWSNGGRGNYWAGYSGSDANHDGVGDTPYIIDKTNTDNYPLMAPVNIQAEPIPPIN